jgi:threonine/homoserine/homoserine lactone efflux protein
MFVHFQTFVALSLLLAIAPGPDTAIVTRNALTAGREAGIATVFGIASGLAIWTLAATLGIAALLQASAPAFLVVKTIGAAYLAFMGLQALWGALRPSGPAPLDPSGHRRLSLRAAYRQGALTNLGNPKIAIFFTSFLPQFAHGDHPSIWALVALGLSFSLIGLGWLTGYTMIVARIGHVLRRPRARRILDGLTGLVFLGFGAKIALEHRS